MLIFCCTSPFNGMFSVCHRSQLISVGKHEPIQLMHTYIRHISPHTNNQGEATNRVAWTVWRDDYVACFKAELKSLHTVLATNVFHFLFMCRLCGRIHQNKKFQ